jgi:serine/threonine protein kinase
MSENEVALVPAPGVSASALAQRSFAVTKLFLRKQLWIWPLLAAAVLGVVGYAIRERVEGTTRATMIIQLQAILDADVAALKVWLNAQQSNVQTAVSTERVANLCREIIELAGKPDTSPPELARSPQAIELASALAPWMKAQECVDFIVANRELRIVASGQDDLVGKSNLPRYAEFLTTALGGKPTVSRPFPSIVMLHDDRGELRSNVPTMFAAAPLRNDANDIVGVLAFRLRPERDFTRILNVAHFGDSGETYAFDPHGLLLSQSRFDDDLKRLGLIPDRDDSHSILNLQIKDPGVDLMAGERPGVRRQEQPLTRMAADATAGHSDVDVDGYRDYRGVLSIAAWTWLPEYGFGVATEVDVADAYRPLYVLRQVFWGLFALLVAGAIAIFICTLVVARLQQAMQRAAIELGKLGQYTLEEKLGEGGMGSVYRGRHAFLRRPTAIKLLNPERTTPEAIQRFEREVQLTSRLNHPNTIAIYDYGRTPEGVFYYAMEYLDGINLEQLVGRYGPQAEGRVIHILRQVCASLAEAHSIGLIHRDVKPANVVLNRRGGVPDFVKLLDFGLVKALGVEREAGLTSTGSITGTPLYISPEAVQNAPTDARSDLYAVGAVGYFLLTSRPVFEGASIVELLMHHVRTPPESPSQRLGRPLADDLESVLLHCLAKNPDDRPASARALSDLLAACRSAGEWSDIEADRWWSTRVLGGTLDTSGPPTSDSRHSATAVWKQEGIGSRE